MGLKYSSSLVFLPWEARAAAVRNLRLLLGPSQLFLQVAWKTLKGFPD